MADLAGLCYHGIRALPDLLCIARSFLSESSLNGRQRYSDLLILTIITTWMLTNTPSGYGAAMEPARSLPLPLKNDSFMLVREQVASFTIVGDNILFMPWKSRLLIRRQISKNPSDIRPFEFSEQSLLSDLPEGSGWLIQALDRGFLLLNKRSLEIRHYSASEKLISKRTLWYDRILPARDRGGEAPSWEIKSFRKKFVRAFKNQQGPRITGLTPVPVSWRRESNTLYLLLSKLKGFPIILMRCQKKDPSQCSIYRGCFANAFKKGNQYPAGITTIPEKREILIGIPAKHQISVLKYHSCYDIRQKQKVALPPRIKEITDLALDYQGNLFISTKRKDDYFNASLFRWRKSQWDSVPPLGKK